MSDLIVTLLGTGNPIPNLDRRGPAFLVQAGEMTSLVDCGEGVLGQILHAGVSPASIPYLFLTHLHADHIVGYPAFLVGSMHMGRQERLKIFGAGGTARMVEQYREIFARDTEYRVEVGFSRLAAEPAVEEVYDGWRWQNGDLAVTARAVQHWRGHECYGFRFEYGGRVLVISGDTAYCSGIVGLAQEADVLINNCSLSKPVPRGGDDQWHQLRARLEDHVCSPRSAARIAIEADVGTLVLTHMQPGTDPEYVGSEVCAAGYNGRVIVGKDLLTVSV